MYGKTRRGGCPHSTTVIKWQQTQAAPVRRAVLPRRDTVTLRSTRGESWNQLLTVTGSGVDPPLAIGHIRLRDTD
jgi:hypothetical protein